MIDRNEREPNDLKKALIKALESLSKESAYHDYLAPIITQLKQNDVIINSTDHKKIIEFVVAPLARFMPNHPNKSNKPNINATQLTQLLDECFRQLPAPKSEPKPASRR